MAKAARKTKRVATTKPSCPVLKTGIEIGKLWKGYNGAEAAIRDGKSNDELAEQVQCHGVLRDLKEWRDVVEKLATFQDATSLAGALIHVVLAVEVAKDLVNHIDPEPNERLMASALYRMLNSTAEVLRNEIGDDFEPLKEFWRVYVGSGVEDDVGFPVDLVRNLPRFVAAETRVRTRPATRSKISAAA